ncbi:MAG: ATP-binding cassette domain-containing protein [Syntrophomonadaceae bacterium]|nr:ATP-binding cassette domain-containing protein [Syntrophomonadaceae bacterium]
MIRKITVMGGLNKSGELEPIPMVEIEPGEIVAVVGPTGSGKSQLISDIEYWADGDTPSRRQILINGLLPGAYAAQSALRRLVAEISQNMNFVIDMSVRDFLVLHAQSRLIDNAENMALEVVDCANQLTGEPLRMDDSLTSLSGGQSRALMVADVALLSNAPIVLVDEIENAGINRLEALKLLAGQGKVVLVVTHDPMLALLADKRVVMKNGGMSRLLTVSPNEKVLLSRLLQTDKVLCELRERIRQGGELNQEMIKEAVYLHGQCISA